MEAGLEVRRRRWIGALAVAGVGGILLAVVFAVRSSPASPDPAPARPPVSLRFSDEGSLTRRSPEEEFLSVSSHATPKDPLPIDAKAPLLEAQRIFGGLREIFSRMKRLSELWKKADPARYAAEMEGLKLELTRLLHAAKALLKDSEIAVQELFRMIREEFDPILKERMAFLLNFVETRLSGPFAIALAESPTAADRKSAIGVLQGIRSADSARALLRRAAGDIEMDLRQRSIVGMGRLIAAPSPESAKYRLDVLDALRAYTGELNEPPIRAAAWDAFSCLHVFAEEDQYRIQNALRSEKDKVVLKSVDSAYRHMNVQIRAAADRANPKSKATPQ